MKITRSLSLLATVFYACSSFAVTLVDLSQQDFRQSKASGVQLNALTQITDKAGNKHIRYEQTFQGIPVYGYQVMEHQYQPTVAARQMALKPYSGTLVQGIEQDIPSVSRRSLTDPQQALKQFQIDYANRHGLHFETLVFENEKARTVIYIDKDNAAHLAHEINFYVDLPEGGMPSRPHFLVDAETSAVLAQWEGLAYQEIGRGPGGNPRTGEYYYGKDQPYLDITQSRKSCTFKNTKGSTVHMNNRFKDSTTPFNYRCMKSTDQTKDAANGAASPLNDAHYFIDAISDFYLDRYNTSPLPIPIVMRAHYGKNFANAFWNGSSMTYGDGNADLYPFVVLDIAAHEIAHGLTEHYSNLIYAGESGGMNEAFSDIASRGVEYHLHGTNDWKLGGDVFKDTSYDAIRYMDNPPLDGGSIDNMADYFEGLDVHFSSGIFNKAYYLLSTTEGWNTMTAFDVMYYANTSYWQPNSTFAEGVLGIMQATAALNLNVDDVVNAFSQVGIQCDKVAQTCI
jgi:vibriolysin